MLIPLKLIRGRQLQQQLYDQLRELIASGRLQARARMPSTRMLAEQFAISRITVILTYERLVAEGILYTLPAAGTFVGSLPAATGQSGASAPSVEGLPRSETGLVGLPDPALFPANRWRAALRHALDKVGLRQPEEDAAGAGKLRAGIAGWLAATRGLNVRPEQILAVSGRRRALDMAAQLVKLSGRAAMVEAPCDATVEIAYAATGARIVPVPVDEDGMRTERLPEGKAALVHVTSGHQNPLGVVLSAARREALLAWAGRSGAFIIEEDQDADLRTDAAVVPPLAAGCETGRVIYVGGFAATMGPWLQLAYLVLPPAMVAVAEMAHRATDEHAAWLEQGALAEFIESGAFARHVHRARRTYAGRRHALAEARARYLPEVMLFGAENGLHQAWLLPAGYGSAEYFVETACRCGLIAAMPCPAPGSEGVPLERIVLVDVARSDETTLEGAMWEIAQAVRPAAWVDAERKVIDAAAD